MFDELDVLLEEEDILGLLRKCDNMDSCHALKYLTFPPLTDEQSLDLLHALLVKRMTVMYSTGKGKTFIASAFIRALKNFKGGKFLFVVKKDQSIQTPKKIESITGLKCAFFSAEYNPEFGYKAFMDNDIIMITHEVFSSLQHYKILTLYKHLFTAIVVDEIHLISNIDDAINAYSLFCYAKSFEYFMGLTATPITTDVKQLGRVLKITDPVVVGDYSSFVSELKEYGTTYLPKSVKDLFVVRTRGKSMRRGYLIDIPAMEHQRGAKGQDMFVVTKGPGAFNQASEVLSQINSRVGQRCIIYSNLHVCQDFLYEYLKSKGLKVALMNGDTPQNERATIMSDFATGELRVVITNITTAVDLECEYVIFYEFTAHTTQFIGRGERGVTPKAMDVLFMVTRDTSEFEYFLRNVYDISNEIQDILDIDLSEITRARLKGGIEYE